jgi:hypothetical protein
MKLNYFSKSLYCFLLAVTLLSSCKKEEKTFTDCLIGTWNVTSFIVDGDDAVADGTSLIVDFLKSTDNTGITNFKFDAGTIDEDITSGTFQTDDSKKTVTLNIDGDVIVFTAVCKDNNLDMVGFIDGETLSLKAVRK